MQQKIFVARKNRIPELSQKCSVTVDADREVVRINLSQEASWRFLTNIGNTSTNTQRNSDRMISYKLNTLSSQLTNSSDHAGSYIVPHFDQVRELAGLTY